MPGLLKSPTLTAVQSSLVFPGGCHACSSVLPEIFFVSVPARQISHIKLLSEQVLPVIGDEAVTGSLPGEWDRWKIPFHFHYLYRTMKGRILHGTDWSRTPLQRRRKHRSEAANRRENDRIDALIESMRKEGYKTQYELGAGMGKRAIRNIPMPAEMIIGMDRSGRLFQLSGGRHRLAISQVLGLPEVPAILSLFHSDGRQFLPAKRRIVRGRPEDFRPF